VEMVLSIFAGWAPAFLIEAIQSMSFLTHFNKIIRGVIDLRDIIFFGSVIGVFLYANAAVVELRKGS